MTNAERVKEMRKETGLSAQKFGDKYGIPLRTIQEWERGGRKAPDYVIDLLAFAVASEKTVPMMYVFEKYRDKGGIGSIKTFTSRSAALEYAQNEWATMNEADQRSYSEDSAGLFRVYLARAEWEEIGEEFVPEEEVLDIWSAF